MNTTVYGEGSLPSDVMICGERPGWEEARSGRPFIGPAGQELWDRARRVAQLSRDDVYVTNLVKTFSTDPPTVADVDTWAPTLRAELHRCHPRIIVTIGYHAARWFLPQFATTRGDYFHGKAFPYTYGHLSPRSATVVPVVHSSAALRQPAKYQQQLTDDLRAVRRVIDGEQGHHQSRPIVPYSCGLAGMVGAEVVGLDTEFSRHTGTEAITVSAEGNDATIFETYDRPPDLSALVHVLTSARHVACHMAKAEYHSFARLGIDLDRLGVRVDDPMLMAYLLGLPHLSLKVLAYREMGIVMREYDDLVEPLDDSNVRRTLTDAYQRYELRSAPNVATPQAKKAAQDLRRRSSRSRSPQDARSHLEQQHGRNGRRGGGINPSEAVPPRLLSSLRRFLTPENPDRPPKDTLRKRWGNSTFAPLVPLPPPPTWKDAPQVERQTYALTDAIAHREVRNILWPRIVARHQQRVYHLDMGVLPFLVRNEQVGLAVDGKGLQDLSRRFLAEFQTTCQAINQLAGYDINPISGEQVSDCLFENLGIRPTRLTKSRKHYTTQDKYLKARRREHEIIPLILLARQLNKYRTTYTDKLPKLLIDGRYHPDWRYALTKTGRLAEQVIVLIPKHGRTKDDLKPTWIRDCFHANDGNRIVSVDLSQIELRVMAHESRDEKMMTAFRDGHDFHAQVAHELLGAPKRKEDQDDSLHRLPAKTLNFAIINGTTEYGVCDQLHEAGQLQWTIESVKEFLDGWLKVYKGFAHFWEAQKAKGRRLGYVEDMFGRRSYLAGLHSTDERIRREAERQCLFAIQSGADGISKVWNRRIWNRIIRNDPDRRWYCEPWNRVHDDTLLEVNRYQAIGVGRRMLELVPDLLDVPTTAEMKIGERWGSLKHAE